MTTRLAWVLALTIACGGAKDDATGGTVTGTADATGTATGSGTGTGTNTGTATGTATGSGTGSTATATGTGTGSTTATGTGSGSGTGGTTATAGTGTGTGSTSGTATGGTTTMAWACGPTLMCNVGETCYEYLDPAGTDSWVCAPPSPSCYGFSDCSCIQCELPGAGGSQVCTDLPGQGAHCTFYL